VRYSVVVPTTVELLIIEVNVIGETCVVTLNAVEASMTEVKIDVTKLVVTVKIVEPPMRDVCVETIKLVKVRKRVDTGVVVNVVVNVERDSPGCEQPKDTILGPAGKHNGRPGY
jgi:hypothetical protein